MHVSINNVVLANAVDKIENFLKDLKAPLTAEDQFRPPINSITCGHHHLVRASVFLASCFPLTELQAPSCRSRRHFEAKPIPLDLQGTTL